MEVATSRFFARFIVAHLVVLHKQRTQPLTLLPLHSLHDSMVTVQSHTSVLSVDTVHPTGLLSQDGSRQFTANFVTVDTTELRHLEGA